MALIKSGDPDLMKVYFKLYFFVFQEYMSMRNLCNYTLLTQNLT